MVTRIEVMIDAKLSSRWHLEYVFRKANVDGLKYCRKILITGVM